MTVSKSRASRLQEAIVKASAALNKLERVLIVVEYAAADSSHSEEAKTRFAERQGFREGLFVLRAAIRAAQIAVVNLRVQTILNDNVTVDH